MARTSATIWSVQKQSHLTTSCALYSLTVMLMFACDFSTLHMSLYNENCTIFAVHTLPFAHRSVHRRRARAAVVRCRLLALTIDARRRRYRRHRHDTSAVFIAFIPNDIFPSQTHVSRSTPCSNCTASAVATEANVSISGAFFFRSGQSQSYTVPCIYRTMTLRGL